MKLTVLVDNNTIIDQYYKGEPAVCYHIEEEGFSMLLDTGYSDLFMENAVALGIDLEKLDAIAISHGHNDHTRGLQFYTEKYSLQSVNLYAHPSAFESKAYEGLPIGAPFTKEILSTKCNLHLTKEPQWITPRLVFLGEIPRTFDFENKSPVGTKETPSGWSPDFVCDDTALAYQTSNGIYIITGCSHSGICNIVEHAKKVCQEGRVLGIIGGFHLFEMNEQATKTIQYLETLNAKALYPCHCTSFEVRAEIHKVMPIQEVGVGLVIEW